MIDAVSLLLPKAAFATMAGDRHREFSVPPKKVIVIGSSGAGKTTLINFIKNKTDLVRNEAVIVPPRYITRPQRTNDDLEENKHVTAEEFDGLVQSRQIDMYWQRDLGDQKKERYGFATVTSSAVLLYSANNAIVKMDSGLYPAESVDDSLIIGIYAPDHKRTERLKKRSPDLFVKKDELAKRLEDNAANIFRYSDIVIDNTGLRQEAIGKSFANILRKLTLL